jgi:ribosome-associated protein
MELLSKTQKKKEALSLQALGERLVALSDEQLKNLELPSGLLNAVTLAKKLKKHGARLRQMQYIGALMRKYDPQPVQEALQRMEQGGREQAEEHREIETCRDELIA